MKLWALEKNMNFCSSSNSTAAYVVYITAMVMDVFVTGELHYNWCLLKHYSVG